MIKPQINIILADDHLILRGGVKAMLEKDVSFNIIAEADTGEGVLQLLQMGAKPDIVLADLNMPLLGGIDLTARLTVGFPEIKVIVLSALDSEKYIVKAFKNGARGYLLKSVSAAELLFAIHHTYNHGHYLCAELSKRFLDRLISIPETVIQDSGHNLEISSLDAEILSHLSEGLTNQEVADKLFISKRTVENHRQQLIDKTGSRNTIALIRFAILNGVI
ncbi:response regulator transcription factor [Mucilaginibacter ginkgonis]|uniref:Response regulator transcription factor n=1 Tax=Mucilaginibacter ginkgonis TaxID=2682091 RepID=A0A6I4HW88_9SPHI|nr:response regulator transcription factor [Mucilaginibacter ginkgonis]QQL51217.1 response regulator transcription factor [Mucilaginibacter ginkgonis]